MKSISVTHYFELARNAPKEDNAEIISHLEILDWTQLEGNKWDVGRAMASIVELALKSRDPLIAKAAAEVIFKSAESYAKKNGYDEHLGMGVTNMMFSRDPEISQQSVETLTALHPMINPTLMRSLIAPAYVPVLQMYPNHEGVRDAVGKAILSFSGNNDARHAFYERAREDLGHAGMQSIYDLVERANWLKNKPTLG